MRFSINWIEYFQLTSCFIAYFNQIHKTTKILTNYSMKSWFIHIILFNVFSSFFEVLSKDKKHTNTLHIHTPIKPANHSPNQVPYKQVWIRYGFFMFLSWKRTSIKICNLTKERIINGNKKEQLNSETKKFMSLDSSPVNNGIYIFNESKQMLMTTKD